MSRSGTSSMKSLSSSFGGMGSLFRGMAAPLSASAIVNAIIFASYGASSRLWDTYVHPSSTHNNTQNDPWQKAFVCGSFAGFVQCLVICPTEHLKCRLQLQQQQLLLQQHTNANNQLLFRGPIHASTAIFKTHGILGIYRGFVSTFWREVPAIGAYFATYDIFKDHISTNIQQRTGQPHPWLVSALSGGLAGCFSWIMIYPIDVIKTRIQTAPMDAPPQTLKMIPVGTAIIQQHGWRSLFRGLSVTLFRAFPVNMIIFPVYEFTLLQIT